MAIFRSSVALTINRVSKLLNIAGNSVYFQDGFEIWF